MKYSQARQGRTFVIRLEDGDILHESIEQFALDHGVLRASLIAVGGADDGSRLVVGPEEDRSPEIVPMVRSLHGVHEATGTGTLFPDADGKPVLHMHLACGRDGNVVAGCARAGVKIWHVLEVILYEILDSDARRIEDTATGFELLEPLG